MDRYSWGTDSQQILSLSLSMPESQHRLSSYAKALNMLTTRKNVWSRFELIEIITHSQMANSNQSGSLLRMSGLRMSADVSSISVETVATAPCSSGSTQIHAASSYNWMPKTRNVYFNFKWLARDLSRQTPNTAGLLLTVHRWSK